jgi:hypothetical protein
MYVYSFMQELHTVLSLDVFPVKILSRISIRQSRPAKMSSQGRRFNLHLERNFDTEISGLPDGIFSNQKVNFGSFWQASERNILTSLWPFGILCGHLLYFIAVWYILDKLLYLFPNFGILYQEKIWQPSMECFCEFWDCPIHMVMR